MSISKHAAFMFISPNGVYVNISSGAIYRIKIRRGGDEINAIANPDEVEEPKWSIGGCRQLPHQRKKLKPLKMGGGR